ncbi:Rap1a/Tai family immunity protein [Ensifer adhaerens]|uniref:Rap1a/Tai family immunity protein n=2 Tax=Ensifer TaxID=106591 RepID=UPI00384B1B71
MRTFCETDNAFITGYIAGWMDKRDKDHKHLYINSITRADDNQRKLLGGLAEDVGERFCLPAGVTFGTIQSAVCGTLQTQKTLTDTTPGDTVVGYSLRVTWPCNDEDE